MNELIIKMQHGKYEDLILPRSVPTGHDLQHRK